MPFDDRTLAIWLGAVGVTKDDSDVDLTLARQLARQELGRTLDAFTGDRIASALHEGQDVADVKVALRGSYERLVRDRYVAGQNSEAFRRLSAVASINGVSASSSEVAECIALYRLVLDREADLGGFVTFLSYRRDESLVVAVREILGSPEAGQHFAPDQAPSLSVALPAVIVAASQILHAVVSDATCGASATMDAKLTRLGEQIEALEKNLERFMERVLLRLDADALET
jgi:hypothetical protein